MAPSKDWKETVDPGEGARFERFAEALHALQKKSAHDSRERKAAAEPES